MTFRYLKQEETKDSHRFFKKVRAFLAHVPFHLVIFMVIFVVVLGFTSGLIQRLQVLTTLRSILTAQQLSGSRAQQLEHLHHVSNFRTNPTLAWVYSHVWPLSDMESIVTATRHMVDGARNALEAVHYFNKSDFEIQTPDNVSTSTNNPFIDGFWDAARQHVEAVKGDIASAYDEVKGLNLDFILSGPQEAQFTKFKNLLGTLDQFSGNSEALISLLNEIFSGQKTLLLLFQNNNELRPTGGFIGTLGEVRLDSGSISSIKVGSIYDLDGSASDKQSTPPLPLAKVNSKWLIRDMNWYADFKASAEKISRTYETHGKATPDCVIAFTPDVFIKILQVTGPIELPAYHVTLDADNFVEVTQIATSVDYDKVQNQPKALLADFTPILLKKITSSSLADKVLIAQKMVESLQSKDILLNCRNPDVQKSLESYNWAGRTLSRSTDYLYVNSTNLSGTKTDRYLKDGYQLKITRVDKNTYLHALSITRENVFNDEPITRNLSYFKVFVPEHITLLSIDGYSQDPLKNIQLPLPSDPDALVWDQDLKKTQYPGVFIGKEQSDTFIGFWVDSPGKTKSQINISYTTITDSGNPDSYQFILQKQPGKLPLPVNIKIQPESSTEWHSSNLDDNFQFNGLLSKDLVFSLLLR